MIWTKQTLCVPRQLLCTRPGLELEPSAQMHLPSSFILLGIAYTVQMLREYAGSLANYKLVFLFSLRNKQASKGDYGKSHESLAHQLENLAARLRAAGAASSSGVCSLLLCVLTHTHSGPGPQPGGLVRAMYNITCLHCCRFPIMTFSWALCA